MRWKIPKSSLLAMTQMRTDHARTNKMKTNPSLVASFILNVLLIGLLFFTIHRFLPPTSTEIVPLIETVQEIEEPK
jgi:uncharacterized BrkB/YihY/UPF0761 family membrane protein